MSIHTCMLMSDVNVMDDEKPESNRNSIGVIKTWVARTGHSLLATKAHKNLLVVLARGGGKAMNSPKSPNLPEVVRELMKLFGSMVGLTTEQP